MRPFCGNGIYLLSDLPLRQCGLEDLLNQAARDLFEVSRGTGLVELGVVHVGVPAQDSPGFVNRNLPFQRRDVLAVLVHHVLEEVEHALLPRHFMAHSRRHTETHGQDAGGGIMDGDQPCSGVQLHAVHSSAIQGAKNGRGSHRVSGVVFKYELAKRRSAFDWASPAPA
ncbi:hypothetical protein D3C73_1013990 [compost metagenome]